MSDDKKQCQVCQQKYAVALHPVFQLLLCPGCTQYLTTKQQRWYEYLRAQQALEKVAGTKER